MWKSCCTCRQNHENKESHILIDTRKVSTTDVEQQQSSLLLKKRISQENDAHVPSDKSEINGNGLKLREERHSLPDVVIPSTLSLSRRYSPPFNYGATCEGGRRQTFDLETTAKLAESESGGFADLSDPSRNNSLVPNFVCLPEKPSDYMMNRASSQSRSHSWAAQLSTSEGIECDEPNKSNKDEVPKPKRSNIKRLFPLLHRHIYKRSLKKSSDKNNASFINNSSGFIEENRESGSKAIFATQDSKDETDENEFSDQDDKLGQLPPISTTGGNILQRLSSKDSLNQTSTLTVLQTERLAKAGLLTNSILPKSQAPKYRRASLCVFSHVDEPIVTPFAQILASLRRVRNNFISLTNVTSSKDYRLGTTQTSGAIEEQRLGVLTLSGSQDQAKLTASDTLEELEWCLDRLENIQTHRSVSDMASNKFKRMLNKELSQFADGVAGGRQISDYICSTFLDSKEDDTGVNTTTFTASAIPSTDQQNKFISSSESGRLPTEESKKLTASTPTSKKIFDNVSVGWKQTCRLDETSSPDLKPGALTDTIPLTLHPYGVETTDAEVLKKTIDDQLDKWGMEVFQLTQLTPNPLTCVFLNILRHRGLIKRFNICEMNLIRFMNSVEDRYNDIPYHSRMHAADVVQSSHVLLNAPALTSLFTDLEVLAVLFASAIHDVGHPGLTNQFLINTNDPLAILYNDASVLENHHLAIAFSLLNQPGCDLFDSLPKKQRQSLRRMTIDMVLATDMSKHMSLLADLKTMVETNKVAGSGVLSLDNYSDRIQILQNLIHCADLSNPAKPLELYRQWNGRVMEEHFLQGDKERALGLELSPMCDRTTASIEKSQVSFIDYIVHPLWESWSDLVYPAAQQIMEILEENREWYQNQITDEGTTIESK